YRDLLAAVSAEDLRLRFFADIAELSAEEMDKLSHLDSHNIAFVALDEDTGQMLGLVRLKEELRGRDGGICGPGALAAQGTRPRMDADAARHRLRQEKRAAAHLRRRAGRKRGHAANVRRARF